jgi:hypothetical protein
MRRRLFTAVSAMSLGLWLAWTGLDVWVFGFDPGGRAAWGYHPERHWAIIGRSLLVLTVLAILPCWWMSARLRQRRRRKNNLCLSCGYNLTANTSGVCPECGTPTTAAVKAEGRI